MDVGRKHTLCRSILHKYHMMYINLLEKMAAGMYQITYESMLT